MLLVNARVQVVGLANLARPIYDYLHRVFLGGRPKT